jgi:hypothetical protein
METDIEGKIRSRIEAILINDARSHSELRMMASNEEPFDLDPFSEERNLYQRIINNYRGAVNEVSALLEENVGFLSGLCRIAETIKDKRNFHEICPHIIDCVLQELGAEFCSLVFPSEDGAPGNALYFEGVRENHKFMCSHSHATLLANPEFAGIIRHLANESGDVLNIADVYREPRFNSIDFPSVVRSLVCLPIHVAQQPLGMLVLSHSLPNYFTQNHTRVLRILAALIAHLRILTGDSPALANPLPPLSNPVAEECQGLSIVVITADTERYGRRMPAETDMVLSIRQPLAQALRGKESILPYENAGYVVFMPDTGPEMLLERTARLRDALECWRAAQGARAQNLNLNLGFAGCEDGEELTRTLEIAAQMMSIDPDDPHSDPIGPDSFRS